VRERSTRHCHGASGLRSLWRFGSQRDEENQLPRVPLELGRFRRQWQERDVVWDGKPRRDMPSRLIEDEDGTSAWRDRNRDFLEMHGHGRRCHVRGFYLSIAPGARGPHVYINTLGRSSKCQIGSKSPILGQCDIAVMRAAQKGIVHPSAARGYAGG
jgi:hypothetical protein